MAVRILTGDVRAMLKTLPDESVNCCVTSPPYWGLRDYGVEGQLGLEPTPAEYVEKMVAVFSEVKRVLRDDGTLWLNLGDSYGATGGDTHSGFNERYSGTGGAGSKQDAMLDGVKGRGADTRLRPKNLIGIPWRVAFALQADGWYLRQDIIWAKPNPMPESVTDRCTKSHEYLFLLAKSERYYFDAKAIAEPATSEQGKGATGRGQQGYAVASGGPSGSPQQDHSGWMGGDGATRNKRSVWTVATAPFSEAHFATFPPALIEPCILAGCPPGGVVLDPFGGAGTTGLVADRHGRDAILCELNPEYAAMAHRRIFNDSPLFAELA